MELNQFRDVDIVLDKANDNIIQKQFVSAGDKDGRSLTAQLTDNGVIGEIIGAAMNLYWHNQASGLTDLSAFYVVDKATSVFKIDYPQNMLTPGKVIAYIQILHGGKVTHTKPFEITVQNLAGTTRGVLATAEYGALVTTLAKANEFETDIAVLGNTKATKTDLSIEKGRIDNLLSLPPGSTTNDARLEDIKVGVDGIVYDSPGTAVRSQVTNGYNLNRNNPISDDLTSSKLHGVYYGHGDNFNSTPRTLATVYTGIVQNIVAGRRYRVTVYRTGAHTYSYLNFYFPNGSVAPRGDANYDMTVIDDEKNIIEVIAPIGATIMTYTQNITNESQSYCKAIFDKMSINWLSVESDNLDKDIKDTVGNAFRLTTEGKFSDDLIYLKEDGFYKGSTWSSNIANAKMGTAHFKVTGGSTYRVRVYKTTGLDTNEAVIYFWDKDNNRISPPTYQYTVVDEANKIIEIIAPTNAVLGTLTYAESSGGKDAHFVNALGGKTSFDWLTVTKGNLDDEIKEKLFVDEGDVKLKYGHSLNKPFDFTGKTVTFFGDSITAGSTSPSLEVTSDSYARLFANKFGMPFQHRAIGGSRFCDPEGQYAIPKRVLAYTDPRDFIFIAGGTNDWTFGSPLGVLGDTTDATFYGSLHVICEYLKTNHPNATVIFITPINQNVSRPLSITSMDAYRNAIFEKATEYGYSVVDGSQIGFPTEQGSFADIMMSDGVHPSLLGHSFYANSLAGILA